MADKIKICHIITRMDRGGSSDVVRLLFEELDPGLFDLTLIYGLSREPALRTRSFLAALGPRAMLVPSLRRDINPFFDIIAFFHVLELLLRHRVDIVHTHTAKAGFLGRLAAKGAGVRAVIHSPHGHNLYGYFGSTMSRLIAAAERFASFFCDAIHVLTQLEAQDMRRARICAPEKLRVIYCGVEEKLLKTDGAAPGFLKESLGLDPGTRLIGYVGRLEPVKGAATLIEAIPLITQRLEGVRFLIAGDGSQREQLEQRCVSLGVREQVSFLGWRDDVALIFSALDVLVMPSLNEAVGRAALEAQAMGVPVIASRVGGIPEIVVDGETGILINPSDPRALAAAVLELCNDEGRRRQMAQAARLRVRESFSDRAMTLRFAELYQRLFNRQRF